jgi:hypothetical protein
MSQKMRGPTMAKRYVIGTANLTADQERAFLRYLNPIDVGWWHWLPNFWLIKDTSVILE